MILIQNHIGYKVNFVPFLIGKIMIEITIKRFCAMFHINLQSNVNFTRSCNVGHNSVDKFMKSEN
jgi:hypothetical protein